MIKDIRIYPALDSLGHLTLKVKVCTLDGFYTSVIPGITSKLKGGGKKSNINRLLKIFPGVKKNFIGLDEKDWSTLDMLLEQVDGTPNFSNLGVNLSLGLSIAVARAATGGELWRLHGPKIKTSFPYPLVSIVSGSGKSKWSEFLIIPYRAKRPNEAINTLLTIWRVIGEELGKKKLALGKTHNNEWICRLDGVKTLELISSVTEDWNVKLGVNFSATGFFDGEAYVQGRKRLKPEKHLDFILELVKRFNIYYLEDPFHMEDFHSFSLLKQGFKGVLAGGDLYYTNIERVLKGIMKKSTNSVVVKPNQVGTIYHTEKVINLLRENDLIPITSCMRGETDDDWLVDLSLVWKAPLMKIGILGPDTGKINRLLELWDDIPNAQMAELP